MSTQHTTIKHTTCSKRNAINNAQSACAINEKSAAHTHDVRATITINERAVFLSKKSAACTTIKQEKTTRTVHRIAVLHGPNLNALGRRDAHHYGTETLACLESYIACVAHDVCLHCTFFHSNNEAELVSFVQDAPLLYEALIINAGAFTHYSYALRDALELARIPAVEVHLSDIYAREAFRHTSVIQAVCCMQISGKGKEGYREALAFLAEHLNSEA